MALRSFAATAVGLLGAAVVVTALPRADATRAPRVLEDALVFMPSPSTLRTASSGFHEVVADLFWLRVGIEYGKDDDSNRLRALRPWFARMLETIHLLDPAWRTPYFYGSLLARANGDLATSNAILERGAAQFPQDFFFPANRAMNAAIFEEDYATAATWMAKAAVLPEAPFWYKADAAATWARAGQRDAAIHMLEQDLARESNPVVRGNLGAILAKQRHNVLVESWEGACIARREAGRRLRAPEELADLGYVLPENPRGDAWIVGGDGVVRSAASERERLRRARMADRDQLAP